MYPYITWWSSKIYMTWAGIIIGFITFLVVVRYLTRKTYQNFRKFFYRLPILTILMYVLGAITTGILENGSFPGGIRERISMLSPYGYNFHFGGVLLGIFIAIVIFLRKVPRIENKKIWIDILFFAFSLAIVPLGIFFMLWDNFIGLPTDLGIGIKALHVESALNKFNSVYPVWLFLSIGTLIVTLITLILKLTKKRTGFGMLGFAMLLFSTNIVLLFQQYPRYGVISFWNVIFDVKQYISFLIIMLCLYIHNKRRQKEISHEISPGISKLLQ